MREVKYCMCDQRIEEEFMQKRGKGRRCCLENRICSIPCRANYFAPGWYDENDELHQDDMKKDEFLTHPLFKSCKIASVAKNCRNSVPK